MKHIEIRSEIGLVFVFISYNLQIEHKDTCKNIAKDGNKSLILSKLPRDNSLSNIYKCVPFYHTNLYRYLIK